MAPALALHTRESAEDNATECTVTDMVFAPMAVSVVEFEEQVDDQATVTELRSPDDNPRERAARLRARRSAVVDVRQVEVPDPSAAGFGSKPAPDLELLVLQQDNVRLQREMEQTRRELAALRASIDGARRVAREATDQSDVWRRIARETESALSCLAKERDHYKAYAHGSFFDRLSACPRFDDVVDR
jgi:hypothetical protein